MRADSGEEALRRLLHDEFAVILLDVQMPRLDGFQTAELIKRRERTRHVPIIFLTAISKDAEHVDRGYESGAVDYITKPFDAGVLRAKVGVFIELWLKTVELRRHEERIREEELAALGREREERYRFLGDSIPQQVWTALPDGNLDYVNERVLTYFGRTFEQMIGWGWSELVHPDDLPRCVELWTESLQTGALYEYEFRLRRADDATYRWHLTRALPMRGDDGEIVQWFGTNTDIEERRIAEGRQQFLAEAGWVLGSSLDYERTLADVAQLVVPQIADWCTIDLLRDGELTRVAIAHADPLKVALARELAERYPADLESSSGPAAVVRTREAELVPVLTPEPFDAAAGDDLQREIVADLGLHSYLCVPLVARDQAFGAISFMQAESGRVYGEDDLALARELARHAAIAIDNAQLYEEAERRAQAARVLESVGDGVVLIDREDVIRLWNPAAAAIVGLSEADVLGRRIADVIPRWDEIARLVPIASSPTEPVRAVTTPVEIHGRELWISGSGVALAEGVVYAFRDLTEEHLLEKMRTDFVATVSHELRTPLAAIYGSAQTIRRPDLELDDTIRDELLDVIASESDRLAAIVSDLLLSSHLDSGRLPVHIESCDAAELATAVVESARTHLPDLVEIELETAADLPPVAADPGQLRQVLGNLVDNAVKYSPGGGTVSVRVENGDGRVRFSVGDSGIGMPVSELRRIFEKFYRLDPDMTRGIGGTGLGLYISGELVRRMAGTISVESQLGKGSTFVVELPAAKSLAGAAGRAGRSRPGRLPGQPRGDVDGHHRKHDHEDGDHVHDRQLIRPREVGQDPDRQRLVGAGREGRHDHLVEGEREREQRAGQERRAELREGDEAERLPRVRAEVGRGLLERLGSPAQPRDHVVVDHDDAESRVPDDDREEAEVEPGRVVGRIQRHPGHDPGQRDRQDHEERDRLATEEAVARHGERGERAEHEREQRRHERHLRRRPERLAHALVLEGTAEPLQAETRDRPRERPALVEGVEPDHEERQVDEGERQRRRAAQEPAGGPRLDHSWSKAPARRAPSR